MGIESITALIKTAGFSEQAGVYGSKLNAELAILEDTLNSDEMIDVPEETKRLILEAFKNAVFILTDGKVNLQIKVPQHGNM